MVADEERSLRPVPTRRLVLLGASNVSRGFATLLTTVRRAWNVPLDVLAAEGRGRSFGLETCFLTRQVPGILACRLWNDWRERPRLPTSALITDVGNDLAYGVPVDQVLAWVEECLRRLSQGCDEIVLTGVPLETLRRVKDWQFLVLRSLFFPGNRAVWSEMLPRVETLDAGLRELAAQHRATFVEPKVEWYGFDAIHVKPSQWGAAWSRIAAAWSTATPIAPVRLAPWQSLQVQRWRPAQFHLFGRAQRREQPCIVLADGTRVSLY